MSATDEFLQNNAAYAAQFSGPLPMPPARAWRWSPAWTRGCAIFPMLGLTGGEAHVIRNAGGTVTDDVIRSLAISQRLLGTTEIMLIHHTDCGMQKTTEDDFKGALEAETGIRPPWAVEAFTDAAADVRQSIGRLKASPFIPHKDAIRGFVFDVDTGKLSEVV